MLNLWKDIQYAFRTLTKNPGFAIIGIVTLALGMAVNTTLFSVINGFLLRPPLSLTQSKSPCFLAAILPARSSPFLLSDFEDFRAQTDSFSDISPSAWHSSRSPWTKRRPLHRQPSLQQFFSALGIQPAYGRLILPRRGSLLALIPLWFWDTPTGAGDLRATPVSWASKWK